MLEIQNNYLLYLTEIQQELEKLLLPKEVKKSLNIEILGEALNEAELLIPVVGAFSAGKSSLLNSFLNQSCLPVGITPETALATELRYSDDEYIEAITRDGSSDRYAINEMEQITAKAKDYKFLRIYLNNSNLIGIEPLVLVDMPGFNSPLDLHNQAISEYLNKGTHYIVLTSVEDGNITRSLARQLTGIKNYGRGFSFFLSKTNLRSESEVREISERIEEQLNEYFDITRKVVAIDNNGGISLNAILKEINPDILFHNLFSDDLKESYYKISETINTSITSLRKGKEANEDEILELQSGLEKIIKKRDEMLEEATQKYSSVNIGKIVNAVGNDLSNSLDELVVAALSGGDGAFSQKISEITRLSLINEVRDAMDTIGQNIINDFSIDLSNFSSMNVSEEWLQKTTESIKILFNKTQSGLGSILAKRNESGNNGSLYKVVSTVLAVTTTVIAPILEVLIIFLPDMISSIFSGIQKRKQEEKLRKMILEQIIPSIKRELRGKLPIVFNEQIQHLIDNISGEFEKKLQDKKNAIAAIEEEKKNHIVNVESEIIKYNMALERINSLASRVVFSKVSM
ncbi:Dynamin family protein [Thiothrix caldifontis]|uniref:Dynamin family protein n=1 Tax=Thiothrix caldifontis TaxID=525918 RepID=A0A1H4BDT8_9GAMM|nr:dynamin family protein [Thiothrix caldifontis]SEA46290.1 Dynamin family protein [Thiothrix caldifontis]